MGRTPTSAVITILFRAQTSRVILLWSLYILVAATTLGVNPFKGETVTPFDLLAAQPAWSTATSSTPIRNDQRSDALDALLPFWLNAKKQLENGRLPLWNDKPTGGEAGLLDLTEALLLPAFWIFAAVPSSPLGFYLAILFNLSVAGLGMHLFLRRHVRFPAAVMGSVTFAFCGFNAAWLYWPHVFTFMWCPWLLLAIDRCAHRPSLVRSVAIAAATSLVILGGFPFVMVLVLEAGGAFALVYFGLHLRSRRNQAWRLLGWYAAGSWLGILACAIPIIAFLDWLRRYNIGYRTGGSFLTWHDWNLLLPFRAWSTRLVEPTMYVGIVCVVLAILGIIVFIARAKPRLNPLPLFGVILLLISAGLVFGVWPSWLVGWLPGMSSNPWSRAICILDISLILLAAFALDEGWSFAIRHRIRLLQATMIAILLGQVGDIAAFFHKFNGAVPAADFYPRTPALQYMQAHVGPFDYVIADESFLVSGTLGAYGLREWFAHGFRTQALKDAMKAMVRDPFTTPTASRFAVSTIRYKSPVMDRFNVRYLALDKAMPLHVVQPEIPANIGKSALRPMPEAHWVQFFNLRRPKALDGISVRLATYRKSNLPGTLSLTLTSADGKSLATSRLDASVVKDNAMQMFSFPHPVSLQAGDYAFQIQYRPERQNAPITAWAWNASAGGTLLVDGRPTPKTLQYALDAIPSHGAAWTQVFAGPNTVIWENTRSPGGPYFVDELGEVPSALSGSKLRVTHYTPESFRLKYEGAESGYVVVPMMWAQGWHVRTNGDPSEPKLVAGVMPAVPVDGAATISFQYQPEPLRWLWPWLALLVATVAVMLAASRRYRLRARDDVCT